MQPKLTSYLFTRMIDRVSCLNCKVILGECVATTQNKLLILDVRPQARSKVKKFKKECKIKWWKLIDQTYRVLLEEGGICSN